MSAAWNSLYVRSDQAGAVAALHDQLLAAGWRPFDPFDGQPGPAYARAVRLFVAPAAGGWVRVLGAVEPDWLSPLSDRLGLCLAASLEDGRAAVTLYVGGQPDAALSGLAPHLRPGRTLADLRAALAAPTGTPAAPTGTPTLPVEALPDETRALLDRVDARQAQALFARLSQGLLGKVGAGSAAGEARALAAAGLLDWERAGGQQLRAFMACLDLPDTWREPDFTTLRDAYALARRRQRRPEARLYPGDAEALARVPQALDYIPVYAGSAD
mgnify:CR=1 FL=1